MEGVHTVWEVSGFHGMVFLAAWTAGVLVYGLFWRSVNRPQPDAVRPSGPVR